MWPKDVSPRSDPAIQYTKAHSSPKPAHSPAVTSPAVNTATSTIPLHLPNHYQNSAFPGATTNTVLSPSTAAAVSPSFNSSSLWSPTFPFSFPSPSPSFLPHLLFSQTEQISPPHPHTMARTKTTPSYRNRAPQRIARDYPELRELDPDSPLGRLHARLQRDAAARNHPLRVTPVQALSPDGRFHFPAPTADEDPDYVRYIQQLRQSLPTYHTRPATPPAASPEVIPVSSSDEESLCSHCHQRLPRRTRPAAALATPVARSAPSPPTTGSPPPTVPASASSSSRPTAATTPAAAGMSLPPTPKPAPPAPAPAPAGPSSAPGPPPITRVYTRRSKPT